MQQNVQHVLVDYVSLLREPQRLWQQHQWRGADVGCWRGTVMSVIGP
jgi:hypothetical protein